MQKETHPGTPPDDKGQQHGQSDTDAVLDPKIQDAIGRSLKAHYDSIVNAPVPDRFLALLAELEAKEQHNGS